MVAENKEKGQIFHSESLNYISILSFPVMTDMKLKFKKNLFLDPRDM